MLDRNLYTGLIRLHILHHAVEGPIFGQAMIDELSRHGYRLSAGTLYPILKRMETHGWLRSEHEPGAGVHSRRYYRLTKDGQAALDIIRAALAELQGEVKPRRKIAARTKTR